MSASATLTLDPTEPESGDTVTATYKVFGNDGTPPHSAVVTGDLTVGEENLEVSTVITLPGTFPLPVSFSLPTCPELTFEATDEDGVFTALVP